MTRLHKILFIELPMLPRRGPPVNMVSTIGNPKLKHSGGGPGKLEKITVGK